MLFEKPELLFNTLLHSLIMADDRNQHRRRRDEGPSDGIQEEVLQIKRVVKKTTGGSHVTFTALVVVGDKKGKVGLGLGRGKEVPQAIQKAIKLARRQMFTVPVYNETLPHDITFKYRAARLILKPAPQGTGLKVGSVVRTIFSLAGITNASGKILGSRNQATNAYAVTLALQKLKTRA